MKTKRIERNELIAVRVPLGDRWKLVDDPKGITHISLTDTLEAFFNNTGFKGSYRLDPLDSKLYIINEEEYEIPVEKTKTYGFYGDIIQGL